MIRIPPFLAALTLATGASAQEAETICLSAGGPEEGTAIAIYGHEGDLLSIAIPPEGSEVPMQNFLFDGLADTFPVLEATITEGLANLPPPPDASTCTGDTVGRVSVAVVYPDAPPLTYDAPCVSAEFLELNDAIITATGDPSGTPVREWFGDVIPAMRDICRTQP